jgi:hypothetical protein
MPLDAYSPPTYRVRDGRASRVVLEQNSTSQADENGIQVSGTREVHQEGEHDHAQHWGFSSRPAQGTELVEILDQYGSRVAVAERIPCPVSIADGDTCIWTSATSYVKLTAAGALAVRSKAGQKVSLGDYSSTKYGAAWWSAGYATGSKVAAGAPLNAWTTSAVADIGNARSSAVSVITLINLMAAWINTAAAILNPVYPAIPLTALVAVGAPSAVATAAIPVGTDHSYVSSGSAHVEVD